MKKKQSSENYLERRPMRKEGLTWSSDEKGLVTLAVENTGIMNRIAQKLLKKPKVSYVHLEEIGSFVWPRMDGEKTILALGEAVKERFGEQAEPLYERLAKYVQILDSYHFIEWRQKEER
ncbi:MAG: PqqD family protein [Lachnospiraceae bacterium]